MTDNNDSTSVHSRAEEVLQVFKKGAEFTQGLLQENERLRYRVLELEQQQHTNASNQEVEQLKKRLQESEAEKQEILDRIRSVEQANLDFTNRYAEIEAENNLLANLYIATYQLHSTFDANEIIRIIEEILLNLVGVEKSTLLLGRAGGPLLEATETESGAHCLVDARGIDPRITAALETGQRWIADREELAQGGGGLIAVVPLLLDGESIGVLAVGRLLAQKAGFTQIDEEIFELLTTHAAMAICTALLNSENLGHISFKSGLIA
ncbi:MAG: GAF domain-containing protein [Geopsychrobacter sp.]|nr:GAF domain-containing protein [Geopsychrobacter sp.]